MRKKSKEKEEKKTMHNASVAHLSHPKQDIDAEYDIF